MMGELSPNVYVPLEKLQQLDVSGHNYRSVMPIFASGIYYSQPETAASILFIVGIVHMGLRQFSELSLCQKRRR